MRSKIWSTAAVVFALVSLAAAQDNKQQPKNSGGEDILTVVGCVQKEADYRAQHNQGRGGVANTGVGESNEFVLRGANTVDKETLKPINTGGTGTNVTYTLTGRLEGELASAVGQQIAVTGYVEKADSAGTNKVKDLPNFNVESWRKVEGRCQ
jgi:hypothetical protein